VRSRILAAILIVAALGLGGAGTITYFVQRERTLGSIDDLLRARVVAARRVAATQQSSTVSQTLYYILQRVLPNTDESSLGVVNGTAKYVPAFASGLRLDRDPAFSKRVASEVAAGKTWLGNTTIGRVPVRYIAVPITVTGSSQKGVYVDAVDTDAGLADVNSSFETYAWIALIALVAIGLVGWFVAGRALRPIRQLRTAASRITASELEERIPVIGQDDVSDLTATVNDMLDRLDTAMTTQRQLLDDVRHELKTPITIVRGHLELLNSTDAKEVEATRALVISELDRMTRLVDDIESLAAAQRGSLDTRLTDVAELTRTVFAKASVLPEHSWELSEVAIVTAEIDAARITQAWLQLADNAAKYSPKHSLVRLGSRLVKQNASVEFWVEDRGSGIPEQSWGRIFSRFGRVDSGRGIEGSGLGLPIVAAIAQGHSGTVSLASSPAGSRFGIVVPLLQPRPATPASIRRRERAKR
jgi:two-component system OmpR family sensor kinase